ncbi:magnesium transporter, partial [Halobium palmae]
MPTEWTVRAITRAMLPVLLVLTLVEIFSGLVLGAFEDSLLRYPSLLVLVPVTIGTAGNLGSILASRLSTAFHLGTLSFDPSDDELLGIALATVALAATVFPAVGVGA